jgi:hypothetical protein
MVDSLPAETEATRPNVPFIDTRREFKPTLQRLASAFDLVSCEPLSWGHNDPNGTWQTTETSNILTADALPSNILTLDRKKAR